MKISRKQLNKLIREAVEGVTWYNYKDDDPSTGELVGTVFPPNETYRSLPHDIQQEPISPEALIKEPKREKDMTDEEYEEELASHKFFMEKIAKLRKHGDPETRRQADLLASSISGGSENPFGAAIDRKTGAKAVENYADLKRAYDRSRAEWEPGAPESIQHLDAEMSDVFESELRQHLEFFADGEGSFPIESTYLNKLYNYLRVVGIDLEKSIKKLEDYLANPKYEAERQAIHAEDQSVLDAVERSIKDMKLNKSHEIERYFEED